MIKSIPKYTILLLFTTLFSQNDIFSQPSDYIGYWKLDGNANDASSNNIHGSSSPDLIYSSGIAEQSAYFTGTGSDEVNLGNYALLNVNKSITISAWIKLNPNYSNSHQMILSKSGTSWYASIYNQKVFLSVSIDGDQTYSEGVMKVTSDEWHHIACSWNANTGEYKTYLDGVLDIETIHYGNALKTNTKNAFIGSYDGRQLPFTGNIDEVLLYDRALSESEINYLFKNPRINLQESQYWNLTESNLYYLGDVAIGRTNVPAGSKFAVDGKIVTKEVNVTLEQWPDFVFKPSYKLMPIEELETYVNQNSHLPSIPSAGDVLENGLNLGEINSNLLHKIEELTLYLIEQNKRIKNLENKNIVLEKELKKIK